MLHSDSLVVSGRKNSTQGSGVPVPVGTIEIKEDVPLFVNCWQGRAGAGRFLLVVHGLGEHSGRYEHLPKFLGDDFERIYAMDLRGHGRSGGLRGYAPSFDHLVEDVKRVAAEIQMRERDKPLFLLAHSMGGLVALRLLLNERKVFFKGAIISAPLLKVALKVPSYKQFLGELIGRFLPKIQISNEVNPSLLSHDPKVVEGYVIDRLVHHKITPRLYLDMTETMQWVCAQTGPVACPVFFIIPGQDQVVDSETTRQFYRDLKCREKDLREYPEMFHEPLNEIHKEVVFDGIREWLKTQEGISKR